MKKFILILANLLFVSCTRTVYVDKNTNEVIESGIKAIRIGDEKWL